MQTETNQEIQTSILEKLVNSKQVNKTLYLHQFKNEQYAITKSEQKWTKLFENSDFMNMSLGITNRLWDKVIFFEIIVHLLLETIQ